MKRIKALSAALTVATIFTAPVAVAANIRIAFIDTLSGTFAPIGINELNSYRLIADLAKKEKWSGDNTIEFVAFDNKGSPQEALTQLKAAIDQGYRYVVQGNGSGVALALVEAINKHNERNPAKEVVYFNHAAMDPQLTGSKCSFWHFRFDANSDMKMDALTAFMAKDKDIKKVYLIGQNYAHGQQVARAAKENLKSKRPDIQIVGDDLHPIAQVKDFSPYVAKIKASGADTVITGNWGADLGLLIKAAKDADLKANFYTYYANSSGVPTTMGAARADSVKLVFNWQANNETFAGKEVVQDFKRRFNDDFSFVSTYTIVKMLSKAMKDTQSTDPVKIAFALEGMKISSLNGEVEMRKNDHQLTQPLYIMSWVKADGGTVKFDQENTGYGWKTNQKINVSSEAQPGSCEMKRPERS